MWWGRHWNQWILLIRITRLKFNNNSSKLLCKACQRARCNSKKTQFSHMFYKLSARQWRSSKRFLPKNKAHSYLSISSNYSKSEQTMPELETNSFKINQKLMDPLETTKSSERSWKDGERTDKLYQIWFVCSIELFMLLHNLLRFIHQNTTNYFDRLNVFISILSKKYVDSWAYYQEIIKIVKIDKYI